MYNESLREFIIHPLRTHETPRQSRLECGRGKEKTENRYYPIYLQVVTRLPTGS